MGTNDDAWPDIVGPGTQNGEHVSGTHVGMRWAAPREIIAGAESSRRCLEGRPTYSMTTRSSDSKW